MSSIMSSSSEILDLQSSDSEICQVKQEIAMERLTIKVKEEGCDQGEITISNMDAKTPSNVKMVKLKSSNSHILEVEEVAATRCELIKRMVEDGCSDGEIPIVNVDGKTLTKVMEWCKKHAGDLGNKKEYEEWKTKFMDMEIIHELYDVMVASNFLEVDLLDWCCVKVAELMKGKTPEEIRKVFKIVNDFTPEEEEEIRKKNYWALGDPK